MTKLLYMTRILHKLRPYLPALLMLMMAWFFLIFPFFAVVLVVGSLLSGAFIYCGVVYKINQARIRMYSASGGMRSPFESNTFRPSEDAFEAEFSNVEGDPDLGPTEPSFRHVTRVIREKAKGFH